MFIKTGHSIFTHSRSSTSLRVVDRGILPIDLVNIYQNNAAISQKFIYFVI
jgi:hypothetical protein